MLQRAFAGRGLQALALFLGVVAAFAMYSSIVGFSDALAFVQNKKTKMKPLSGTLGAICSVAPARQQFGYFAPQVCSEFRLLVSLGNSKNGQLKDVHLNLSSEAELLLTSMNSSAQEGLAAKVIAAAHAAYAMNQEPQYDFAQVSVQAEYLPPLDQATKIKPRWITFKSFYFKR